MAKLTQEDIQRIIKEMEEQEIEYHEMVEYYLNFVSEHEDAGDRI